LKKIAKIIRNVGLIGNSEKAAARGVIREAARLIERTGRRFYCDRVTARLAGLKCDSYPDTATLTAAVDLVLVFGGDGTMLRVAREVAGLRTPVLGINVGGLGFLTDVSSSEIKEGLRSVWAGKYFLESRPLIEVTGQCRGAPIRHSAFNDIVISRGIISRLITLEVSVNGDLLTRYRCDGLIVSSPTGSTAYSLSAGGAVIHPRADVFGLTPICPHALSNRSVIVSLSSTICVKVAGPRPETVLSADGCHLSHMDSGDSITIRRSRNSVRLMHLSDSTFFNTLRQKLHWSGANF